LKRASKKIGTVVTPFVKSAQTTRLVRDASELFWRILNVVSGIQISVDALVAENDLVKSRKVVYLTGVILLTVLAVTFPDKIPSFLSSLRVDITPILERTHDAIKAIKKLLPAF